MIYLKMLFLMNTYCTFFIFYKKLKNIYSLRDLKNNLNTNEVSTDNHNAT